MKISVITVCWNSSATIGDTIASFLAQRHADKELLVVDGQSTDDTVNIARAYNAPSIRIISERDKGPFDAMNKGLRLYSGEAVGVLNSDDTFHDDLALTRIAAGLADADIVYGDLDFVSDHRTKTVMREWRAGEFRRGLFRTGWMPPHPTFYARRAVLDRVGEFDISYRATADYDLMLRAMELNDFRIRYIPQILADFQLGGISTRNWRATIDGNLECLRARRIHLGAPPVDAALFLRPLRKLFELRRLRGYYKG
ncbi:MAG: glycosyltransferase family 2 protein [Rhizomicrobium sp.]